MLETKYRITKNKEFEAVMKNGQVFYSQTFLMKVIKNELTYSRFGLIVSNKVNKNAVRRSLVKRRIREIIRTNFKNIKKGFDFVIIASPKIIKEDKVLDYKEIEENILFTLKKTKLL